MNIILNESLNLRMTCSDNEEFHSLIETNFYIPKNFLLNNDLFCIIDDENTLPLIYTEKENQNYYIFKINESEIKTPILITQGIHNLIISYNNKKSSVLAVSLKDYYKTNEEDTEGIKDEDFIIQIKDRKILISENNSNIIVAGDNKSQLITFQLKRYQDGIDISQKIITINYINALAEKYQANITNLKIYDNYILFSWLITSAVSKAPGTVIFSIRISGDITKDEPDTYIWQSLPAKIIVRKNLEGNEITVEPDSDVLPQWYLDILEEIDKIGEKSITYWEDI